MITNATADAFRHGFKVVGVALTPAKHKQLANPFHRIVEKAPQRGLAIALGQRQIAYGISWLDTSTYPSMEKKYILKLSPTENL